MIDQHPVRVGPQQSGPKNAFEGFKGGIGHRYLLFVVRD
jgi:hypothetical protein